MKLYNGGKIIAGIVVFLLLTTFPFWYDRGAKTAPPDLRLDTPAIGALREKRCVESAAFMRMNHVPLLADWKGLVVRDGLRSYRATDGRVHPVTLTGSCLHCHSNKKEFCDRCHDYAGAKPKCYRCHNIPGEVRP
ncbi:MAG: sulfate reduction electron transfer complex DsrMKJOP subunit DsrJ [Smithellaceae bacterium]|nr:sulfate reduction electron transfer complex DsrMKJOP subunit DsrJ [Smithellaceae bacterium]